MSEKKFPTSSSLESTAAITHETTSSSNNFCIVNFLMSEEGAKIAHGETSLLPAALPSLKEILKFRAAYAKTIGTEHAHLMPTEEEVRVFNKKRFNP